MELELSKLIEIIKPKSVHLDRDFKVKGISIDSRTIRNNEVFLALKGERFDGNDFACEAVRKSKTFAIVEKSVDCPHLLVENTLEALKRLASHNLGASRAVSIAIVGSVGKTTTKELLAQFLSCKSRVCRSFGNENNVIGVCKTLLNLRDEDFCVVEVGVNKPNEMGEIAEFFKPDGVLFLNVGRVHLEFFGSIENVLSEKSKIIHDNSVLVYNGDDTMLRDAFGSRKNSYCYSFLDGCDFRIRGDDVSVLVEGSSLNVRLKKRDDINSQNVAAAVSCAFVFAGDIEEGCLRDILDQFETVGLRMSREHLGETEVILDCYNANVDSMKYAIDILSKYNGKKLAVLGDMFELGSFSEQLHREVGKYLEDRNIDVCCIGADARFIYDEVKKKNRAWYFTDRQFLVKFLKKNIENYDVVLFKASRGMRLEEIYESMRN